MNLTAALVLFTLICCCTTAAAVGQSLSTVVPDGKPHLFEARDKQFFIDSQPTMLLAGEMHFGRVLPEFWEHRIKQARAMGLNALSMYLFWNQAEPRNGQFAFTGANDVRRFVKLCQDNGMWVILRPGPYCCAETEFGGIPWWLLKEKDIRLRTNHPKFLEYARRYIGKVFEQVGDLQVSRGGPVVMVQLDNEYGRADDYMRSLQKIFTEAGCEAQLFTCDHSRVPIWTSGQTLPGVIHCRNGLKNEEMFQQSAKTIGDYPVFSPEVYTAWFSVWGAKIETRPIEEQLTWTNWLIDHGYSFALYMYHGGTNFGFQAGANGWRPTQTSYNYDAPVDEAGRATAKYRAMRELIAKRFKRELPPVPDDPKMIQIPAIKLVEQCPLLDTRPEKPTLESTEPVSMEDVDQGYGFILYRKRFADGLRGTLELRRAMDYAIVMVNGKTVGRSFVGYGARSGSIELNEPGAALLDILVHNLGRVSSPFNQNSGRKGLIEAPTLDGKKLEGWQTYSMPMETMDGLRLRAKPPIGGPTLYRGTFSLAERGETFLDMRHWGFGVMWVNGHNLGRYWDRGALRSLYLPSVWQKAGENEIVILELHDPPKAAEVSGVTEIVQDAPRPFEGQRPAPPVTQPF